MLKYILFLLSEEYYKVVYQRKSEICENIRPKQVEIKVKRAAEIQKSGGEAHRLENRRFETLAITDIPDAASQLLKEGWYVVALYHEGNRKESFPSVQYGMEDIFQVEYQTYEAAYKRMAGLPWDIFETERLRVRESTVEDVEAFYRIYSEPSVTFYMEDLYEDKELEQDYMKAYIDQIYGFYGYGLWSVLLKETGRVIGRAGLSVRKGYELPELGFVIDVTHQHKGYGFEVCTAILAYAKKELAFGQVQALVDKDNLVSKKLLDKLGFIFDSRVSVECHNYELFIRTL
ncbi:GNAT family N-acetyltransferase [Parablautia muri]|uniref:N-acetyltransferase n=1 Tax=Parablautia muri TaxID=2320879 RepID=A0A9X5GSB0_9FIRM|nr:GNAT family N-acetyltransferase [Parablautia muri]NBJ91872.1 N-acetyltransferase [Parablautia muri]